jgi:serine/threonine protein kinase
MAYENWQQIKEIFVDALRQTPAERPQFLDRVCSDDNVLRREVESLLSSFDSAKNFMETPAVAEVADKVLMESRKFSKGQSLGHYEIIKQIGSGGMGKVYLAQDSRLNRRVALKVLHQNLLSDKQANERLLREARAAASLDHPNICQIYEISAADDCNFIVMQYVEGETLAEILAKERLSVNRALSLAIQIADALAEAHARKIVHRDIKPANIIINEKGQAKVLDFGLAKLIEAKTKEETAQNLSNSGAVMGTVPYMSPEQLRGKTLDARTDIFSFGVLVYEMLSGRQAFSRENNAETISAILNDEPSLTVIPPKLREIVEKSLMKERDRRYQTAKDLTRDLYNLQQSGEILTRTSGKFGEGFNAPTISNTMFERIFPRETADSSPKPPPFYLWTNLTETIRVAPETESNRNGKTAEHQTAGLNLPIVFAAFAVIFILIGAATWFAWQPKKIDDSHSFDSLRPVRLVSWKTGASSIYSDYSSSHDGKMIAYSSTQEGANEGIYVKQTVDGQEIRVVKDEWKNHSPIWSPDDQRIAFASYREGRFGIYYCPFLGGRTTLLKTIGDGLLFLRHWSKDGSTIFYEYDANLYRLDIATQETAQITNFNPSRKDYDQRYFSFSPDESKIAYCNGSDGQSDVWLMPVNGGTPLRITNDKEKESRPSWHPDGKRILYTVFRDDHYQINAVYLDGRTPEQVTRGENEHQLIDVSTDGTKIFYLTWENKSDIWAVKAESGEESEVAAGIESEFWTDVSPDGKIIAYQTNAMSNPGSFLPKSSIVIRSLTNRSVQLSLKGCNPRWLPDSLRVAFLRWQEAEQKYNLWIVNVISGEEKIINNLVDYPRYSLLPYNRTQVINFSWSPDNNQVAYLSKESGIWNLQVTSLQSNETANILNNTDPNVIYYCPLWSPDGNHIAYVSRQEPLTKQEKPFWGVWLIEQGTPKEIFSTSASLRLLGWSSNGELILEMADGVMKSDPLDIKLLRVSATGENRIVTTLKNIYALSMTLSTDGKTVAFTSRQDSKDNIWTADTTNGEARKTTANADPKLFFGSLAWAPDGKTIYFDKQEEINTISMFENFK